MQVLLYAYSALKIADKDAWIHHSGESRTKLPVMILLLLLLNAVGGIPWQHITPGSNWWILLAKTALNNSDEFCVRYGSDVTKVATTCFIGVSTPLSLIHNGSNLPNFKVNLTYSQLPNTGKVSSLAPWTNQHAMRFQLLIVTPAESCIYSVKDTAPSVNLINSNFCNTTKKVFYYFTDLYLPKGWFILCGHLAPWENQEMCPSQAHFREGD